MGFPAGYCALLIPTFLFKLVCALPYASKAISCLLSRLGLAEQESFDFPSAISPVSTDKILELLPVIMFRDFAERLKEMEEDFVCVVCLSSFKKEDEVRELWNCCHIFHRNCLDKWIDHHQQTCPLCRCSLLPQMEEEEEEEENGNGWMVDQISYLLGQDLMV